MRKEFVINIAFLLFINLLIKPFYIFGIDLTVQNRAGEDYGLYFALFNFAYLFQIFNDFGIQNFNSQTISKHPQMLPKYFPNLLALKAVMGLFYFVLSMLAAWLLAGYGREALPLLGILLLNQILVQFIFFFRSNISGLGHFRSDSMLSTLDKLLMIGTCGYVLWIDPIVAPFTIYHFVWAQTVALLITVLVAVFVFLHYLHAPLKLRMRKAFIYSLFRKSIPFALIILLMGAFTRLDGVLLERLLDDGKYQAEIYAGAYRLLDASNMLGLLFATLLLPMFARMLKAKESLLPLVRMSGGLLWVGSITLSVAIYFSKTDLMTLMYSEHIGHRSAVLGVLFWTFIAVCSNYIFGTLLIAAEKLNKMNWIFLFGVFFNVILCLTLIPSYKAEGAAFAALITHIYVAISLLYLCIQAGYFSFGDLQPWKYLIFPVLLLPFADFVFEKLPIEWYYQCFLVLMAGGLGALVLFFPDIKKQLYAK